MCFPVLGGTRGKNPARIPEENFPEEFELHLFEHD
jgi:hypothetical protein